jgi:hypothetical protein
VTSDIETILRVLGVRCKVERRGALAVLTPAAGERSLERPEVRREVLSVLRAHGFTHAALELPDDDDDRA